MPLSPVSRRTLFPPPCAAFDSLFWRLSAARLSSSRPKGATSSLNAMSSFVEKERPSLDASSVEDNVRVPVADASPREGRRKPRLMLSPSVTLPVSQEFFRDPVRLTCVTEFLREPGRDASVGSSGISAIKLLAEAFVACLAFDRVRFVKLGRLVELSCRSTELRVGLLGTVLPAPLLPLAPRSPLEREAWSNISSVSSEPGSSWMTGFSFSGSRMGNSGRSGRRAAVSISQALGLTPQAAMRMAVRSSLSLKATLAP
mmetsp:Transcript_4710/g.6725  ORF Transcript_4710/g.6725 Transcript_4710/m.6725 type:complete len:258 (-) Transcript_4710:429-1202(-)